MRGKRVLEYGCGHGRMAAEFPGFAEYLGIDHAGLCRSPLGKLLSVSFFAVRVRRP